MKEFKDANHPPTSPLDVNRFAHVEIRAKPGEAATLAGKDWTDPDGDALTYRWSYYPEAGDFAGDVAIEDADHETARVTCPPGASAKTLHFILAVTDTGHPPLTRYQRVVIRVDSSR